MLDSINIATTNVAKRNILIRSYELPMDASHYEQAPMD
jgi:hypothetical protein